MTFINTKYYRYGVAILLFVYIFLAFSVFMAQCASGKLQLEYQQFQVTISGIISMTNTKLSIGGNYIHKDADILLQLSEYINYSEENKKIYMTYSADIYNKLNRDIYYRSVLDFYGKEINNLFASSTEENIRITKFAKQEGFWSGVILILSIISTPLSMFMATHINKWIEEKFY